MKKTTNKKNTTTQFVHPSMRGWFAASVYEEMKVNQNIWVIVGDFGYGMWDRVREDFPDRFINTGAAEQAMMGIAVGLALEGKIPVVYTVSTFLLYRPFETIRNYVNYEKLPVKLAGSGRAGDYPHDGISHWAPEDKEVMKIFKNIKAFWPNTKEEMPSLVKAMVKDENPWYINLVRAASPEPNQRTPILPRSKK